MDAAGAGRDPAFPMQQIPMLLFPPPPLAAYSSSSSSTTPHHPSITSFPILVLTVLGILTTSVLLLTYYVFVIRCCLNWHSSSDVPGLISRRRGASSGLPVATVRGAPAGARGLEESAIQALPAFRYRKAINNTVDSNECTVCLSEFQEEEMVRLLPSCLHVFHVDCIDTWLQGNANCPLCRAAITTATSSSCHRQLPLMDQLPRPEEVVIQVVTGTAEEGTQTQQQQEAAESAGDTTTDQQASSKKRKNIKPWHDVTSKGDECIEVKRDRDVLPMRRSFSMDSLDGGRFTCRFKRFLQNNTHFHGDDSDSSSSSTLWGF